MMKEIAPNVIIETAFKGPTVGAVRTDDGVVMIDIPMTTNEFQSWQTTCLRSGAGLHRLLILLDDHPDRTAGGRHNRCPIIVHEKTAYTLKSRPTATKMQGMETGAMWETIPEITTIDWARPEITFSDSITINWGKHPIIVESHPGPAPGASWVAIPNLRIVFVGDAVTPGSPPFLYAAEIEHWLDSLDILKSPKFKDYLIISGRAALVTKEDIRQGQRILKKTLRILEKLNHQQADLAKVQKAAISFLDEFNAKNKAEKGVFRARLSYGFSKYYINHYTKKK
jgi:glyoxylase-like metal-dependent hydrolase (beta-lactamase superfamily II)